jgi:ATP-dependent helicase/DNAse subunit B
MHPRLILAPASSGKTTHLVQHIRRVKAASPLAPVLVVVPNLLQAAGFQRRLAADGGAPGIEILTFHNLYAEILARAGQPIAALLDPVQIRLLRAIVDELCADNRMRYYAALRTRPGFILALRNAIQELKRARVFPEVFSVAVQGLGARLEELATVYTAYQDWLQAQHLADLEGRGWLAAIALDETPTLGTDLRLLVITGFDEFNPTQLSVLSLLARRAGETLISLTGDPTRPLRPAHRRFQRALLALTELNAQTETLPAYSFMAPMLAHLEANLFETTPNSAPAEIRASSPPPVAFLEAQNRAAEARAALRWIKARIVRDGMALHDVAVLAHNLEPYRLFLEEAANEFGIPLRIIGGLPLAQNPAVAALLSLLSLPATNWPRRPMIEAWRSPYFDWSAIGISAGRFGSAADASTLDALSRQGRVIAGINQWQEAFNLWERQNPLPETDEEELQFAVRVTAGGLRQKFDALLVLLTPPATASVRDYISFIEDLIGSDPAIRPWHRQMQTTQVESSLQMVAQARANPATAERDLAALIAFKDVLRGLVLAEAALNNPPLDYTAFYTELHGAVEAASYTTTAQVGVLITSTINARGLSFRALALLGLSEGEFPRPEREDPFLSEAERHVLQVRGIPLESYLRGDQGTIFYQAVTRARQRLLLTRPYLADDGQPWEESPYWKQIHRLMGQPAIQHVHPEDAIPPDEACSPVELLSGGGSPPALLGEHIARGIAVLQARLARNATSAYEGELPELAEAQAVRYPAAFGWSASKLEAYGICPFYFYVAYALGLEPRTPPEEGYDVRMLGSMLHQILEDTYAQAQDPTDLNECLARVETAAGEVFAAAPTNYGFRPTPLWVQQQQELIRILRQTITALAEKSQGFTPRYFEQKFGMGSPSLVLADPGDHATSGHIRLHGYIDRIDSAADGSLQVIDYKAGGAAISSRHLQEGRRLQLPLYALAARQALGLGEIAGGFYWHIQKAEASSLKLEDYPGGIQAACETAVEHVIRHVGNIRSGQFQPLPPPDGCPSYCPAAGFCWRYKSKGF